MERPKAVTPLAETAGAGHPSLEQLKAAAIAGVLAFLKSEEEARRLSFRVNAPGTGPGPWVLQARRGIMQMRALIQARVLKRDVKGAFHKRLR